MYNKKEFAIKRLSILAMLVAITVILAVFCTIRIGNAIKIPLKFITVFITAALYGPICGGVVGALGDILNSFLVPIGIPLPQITIVEFIYGVIMGLFFYKRQGVYINTVICSVILTLLDIFVVSYILTSVGYFPSVSVAISMRIIASLIKFLIYILVFPILKKYLPSLERNIN